MHPHVEEWDRYWKDKSIKKRMNNFFRRNYFSKKEIKTITIVELSDVKVNYLWKTGGLTISGSGKAK